MYNYVNIIAIAFFAVLLLYLWELGETGVGKQRNVSQQLVADVPMLDILKKSSLILWNFSLNDVFLHFYFSPQQADSRFWCVRGPGAVANVLRGMEDAEGQSSQKVARREEAGHGAEPKACARCGKKAERQERWGGRSVEFILFMTWREICQKTRLC